MLIRLIRNQPKGSAITGRLVINGRYFCNTLERVGYQIPALCYPVRVTMSPRFKRLLPLVCGVPSGVESCRIVEDSVESSSAEKTMLNHSTQPLHKATPCAMRSGIRFHRGTKPEHSSGCVLLPDSETENKLTNLLKETQEAHEEIILEVTDFRPGTEYGYNTPCPIEIQKR
jgi:hypothetical protein